LGNDGVLPFPDGEDAQCSEPDQDNDEAEDSGELDAARENGGGQHLTSVSNLTATTRNSSRHRGVIKCSKAGAARAAPDTSLSAALSTEPRRDLEILRVARATP
jgi:hypothetical protein